MTLREAQQAERQALSDMHESIAECARQERRFVRTAATLSALTVGALLALGAWSGSLVCRGVLAGAIVAWVAVKVAAARAALKAAHSQQEVGRDGEL